MERLCTQMGNSDVYGFVDPFFIHAENNQDCSQSHITAKLFEGKKVCYFAPYLRVSAFDLQSKFFAIINHLYIGKNLI